MRRSRVRRGRVGKLALVILMATSAIGTVATPAAGTSSATGDTLVVRWNEVVLDSLRNSKMGPPMVARAVGAVHTCMYDAWAAYDLLAAGTQYGGSLRRPITEHTKANKEKAISYAAHRAALDMFPDSKPQLDAFMSSLGYDPNLEPLGTTTPEGVGATACGAVLSELHHDGANQYGTRNNSEKYSDWTGYEPVNKPMVVSEPFDPATVVDPNRWQPLIYEDQTGETSVHGFLGAQWGEVEPFALIADVVQSPLSPPAKYGSAEYITQASEVLALSARLTDRQKTIAEYWADGPNSEQPPGHWAGLFSQFVSRRDNHTLDQDVKMFFAVANAVADAAIASWDSKRDFDYVRPVTAIRYLYHGEPVLAWSGPGKGTAVIDGGEWTPYQANWFPTPPFPEFVSGHSAFSAAAAEVLKSFTGSDRFGYSHTVKAGSSFVEPGLVPAQDVVLSWPTFSDAADEAGISRRYGGIHFEQGDLDGRVMGRLVGTQVWLKATRCFIGLCI